MSKQISESICTFSNELMDQDDLVESLFKKRKGKGSKKNKGSSDDEPRSISANLYMPMVCHKMLLICCYNPKCIYVVSLTYLISSNPIRQEMET